MVDGQKLGFYGLFRHEWMDQQTIRSRNGLIFCTILLHAMHTTNHPSNVKIFLIFQKSIHLVALVYVSRGKTRLPVPTSLQTFMEWHQTWQDGSPWPMKHKNQLVAQQHCALPCIRHGRRPKTRVLVPFWTLMDGSTDHTIMEWVNFLHHAPTCHAHH